VHIDTEEGLGNVVELRAKQNDDKTPGDGRDQDDLGPPGNPAKADRDNVPGKQRRGQPQQADAGERQQDRAGLRVFQAGQQRDRGDRPDVLEYQDAQRDPAGDRVQLEGLLEQLDYQQRRRGGDNETDVQGA